MLNSGSDWIENRFKVNLSPFGVMVANLLADVFDGIYHINVENLKKVDWENSDFISLRCEYELSTFDNSYLTRLVIACHDRLIRMSIRCKGKYLILNFSRRSGRPRYDGGDKVWEVHPSIEQAIRVFRN